MIDENKPRFLLGHCQCDECEEVVQGVFAIVGKRKAHVALRTTEVFCANCWRSEASEEDLQEFVLWADVMLSDMLFGA